MIIRLAGNYGYVLISIHNDANPPPPTLPEASFEIGGWEGVDTHHFPIKQCRCVLMCSENNYKYRQQWHRLQSKALCKFWNSRHIIGKNDKSINYLIQWKTSNLSFEYQLINVFINDTFVILREIRLVYILFRIIGKEFWPIKWYHITSGSTTWRPPLT